MKTSKLEWGDLGLTLPALPALPALAVLAVAGALSCAHQKPAAAPERPAPAPVTVKLEPAAAAEPAAPPAPELEAILAGAVVQFDFDRATLSSEGTHLLNRVADALKAQKGARVRVAGHCDERGTQEYNLSLGHQRASAARDYLIALGIDGARIDTVSYGAEKPLDPGHDEQAHAKNRRDELTRVR